MRFVVGAVLEEWMDILGLDFTSAPSRRKPITLAECTLEGDRLTVREVRHIPDFAGFDAVLASDGPWIAGLDFPFGQPRLLIEHIGWPPTWEGYVETVSSLGKEGFEAALGAYRRPRPAGDKQHRRACDVRADSRSPMMLAGVPVGKMFFQGAPRLLASGCAIVPVRPTAAARIVVEAYPALVARRWAGRAGYKSDDRRKQTAAKEAARRAIVAGLRSPGCAAVYGVSVAVSDALAGQVALDPTADRLDAVLCAVQAAWAWGRRDAGFGVPPGCDLLEGWIVDPGTG